MFNFSDNDNGITAFLVITRNKKDHFKTNNFWEKIEKNLEKENNYMPAEL